MYRFLSLVLLTAAPLPVLGSRQPVFHLCSFVIKGYFENTNLLNGFTDPASGLEQMRVCEGEWLWAVPLVLEPAG